jgi:undecaprenyl-phosphate 4-deoxy-4-formamido-L-arabinose transferase
MLEKNDAIDLSVVIPAYNSSIALKQVLEDTALVFKNANIRGEIIVVNDGGNEDTWQNINLWIQAITCRTTAIRLTRNFGQHNATLCGIGYCSAPAIVTIDDDMQNVPEDIVLLYEAYKESDCDLVYGIFDKKHHGTVQNMGSAYVKKSSAVLMDNPGKGSSFRLIKRTLAQQIFQHQQSFVYIDELLLWYTDHIKYVKVRHQKSVAPSRYGLLKLFIMSFNITTNYTALPLKFITYLGLFSSIFSFVLGLFFIYRKLVKDVPMGYTSMIVAVLFSASIIMLSLGILGQYIFKMYQSQQKRPMYTIRKRTEHSPADATE